MSVSKWLETLEESSLSRENRAIKLENLLTNLDDPRSLINSPDYKCMRQKVLTLIMDAYPESFDEEYPVLDESHFFSSYTIEPFLNVFAPTTQMVFGIDSIVVKLVKESRRVLYGRYQIRCGYEAVNAYHSASEMCATYFDSYDSWRITGAESVSIESRTEKFLEWVNMCDGFIVPDAARSAKAGRYVFVN